MSFLITVTLALVFITTQIDQNLAPAGRRSLPLISWLVLGNYCILGMILDLIRIIRSLSYCLIESSTYVFALCLTKLISSVTIRSLLK